MHTVIDLAQMCRHNSVLKLYSIVYVTFMTSSQPGQYKRLLFWMLQTDGQRKGAEYFINSG